MRIPDEFIDQLHDQGYVLVPGFLDGDELDRCRQEVGDCFPTGRELVADRERIPNLKRAFGFPFAGAELNRIALHPELLSFVRRVLGTERLRLGNALLQAKYGPGVSEAKEQRLHNDSWGRNTLVHPRVDGVFQRVLVMIYYTDVTEETGPTHVVHRKHTASVPLISSSGYSVYEAAEYPQLYARQRPITAPAGTALIFTGQTVHRGSAIRAPQAHRFTQFLAYHSTASSWLDKETWAGSPASAEGPAVHRLIVEATPWQRELLGFPAPGDAYWTEETLRGTAELYPGIDLAPYEAG